MEKKIDWKKINSLIESNLDWEKIKKRYKIGQKVSGTVERHAPFGIFVNLQDKEVRGLIQIIDFMDKEQGRMSTDKYPPIGSEITAIVIGYAEDQRNQIRLSVKPSILKKANF